MPASATDTYTNVRLDPYVKAAEAMRSIRHVAFAASLALAKGTVVGQVTVGGLFKAYNNGNADGSEVARGVLEYSITTDGSGNVTIGNEPVAKKSAPVFFHGDFRSEDLTGMDAAGLADLQGRVVIGDLTTGHITF